MLTFGQGSNTEQVGGADFGEEGIVYLHCVHDTLILFHKIFTGD